MTQTPDLHEIELSLFLEGFYQYFGEDFRGYERAPLRQKIQEWMTAEAIHTISGLQERVLHDATAARAFSQTLMAPATGLFQNHPKFHALMDVLTASLRSYAAPNIWIVDCACTEEVFSLAILISEVGIYDKTKIYVTAANADILQKIEQANFPAQRWEEYKINYRNAGGKGHLSDYCTERDGQFWFAESLKRNIVWSQYSLVTDRSFNEFQLIYCNTSLAHFGPALRARAFALFNDSLSIFGTLSLEKNRHYDDLTFFASYEAISHMHGLYKKIG
ncbi:MAG: CheR family methyltransferase [Pseudomonadota bacterium]